MATHPQILSQEYLKECFSYDPDSGILTWRERPREHFKTESAWKALNTRHYGKKAGTLSHGYMLVKISGRIYLTHRIVWKMQTGNWPSAIDHISGDRSDNRMSNLREATQSQNMRNAAISRRNTSGTTGVSWRGLMNKWEANIGVDGELIYLGLFSTKEDAIAARKAAESKYGFHKNHGRQRVSP